MILRETLLVFLESKARETLETLPTSDCLKCLVCQAIPMSLQCSSQSVFCFLENYY